MLDADDKPTDEIYLLKEFYPENGALRDENDTVRVLRTNDKDAYYMYFGGRMESIAESARFINEKIGNNKFLSTIHNLRVRARSTKKK